MVFKKKHPPALAALVEHHRQYAVVSAQIHPLQAKIEQATAAAAGAEQPSQKAQQLRGQRRSLLARFFLGDAVDETEVAKIDNDIAAAEAAAGEQSRTAEGANAAIEVLQEQVNEISRQCMTIAAEQPGLIYAALLEYAEEARPDLEAAMQGVSEAYATYIGRCRAVDEYADPAIGLKPVSVLLSSTLKLEIPSNLGGTFLATRKDLSNEIAAKRDAALALIRNATIA